MMQGNTQTWKIGDCIDLLPEIEDKSINMILCDLPYGKTACSWDTIIPFEPLWKEYKRIITDDGAIVLTANQPFTTKLISSNMDMFKYCWVWIKPQGVDPFMSKFRPLSNIEDIVIFSNGKCVYNPQKLIGKKYSITRDKNQRIKKTNNFEMKETTTKNSGNRLPLRTLYFNQEKGIHPTQKPVALFEYLIKTYTNEGDWVHDSCLGSGTTLEACRNTNRNCIGFEISDEWEKYYPDRAMAHTPPLTAYFGETDE